MSILVDVDGVVANLVGDLCARIPGGHFRHEDFNRYEFADVVGAADLAIVHNVMREPGFVLNMSDYAGARDFLDALAWAGPVVAVTKPFETSHTWPWERAQWLKRRGVHRVIHTSEKHLVKGEILIEDSADNLARWLLAHPEKLGILIDRPWNRDVRDMARLHRVALDCPILGRRWYRAHSFTEALEIVKGNE